MVASEVQYCNDYWACLARALNGRINRNAELATWKTAVYSTDLVQLNARSRETREQRVRVKRGTTYVLTTNKHLSTLASRVWAHARARLIEIGGNTIALNVRSDH